MNKEKKSLLLNLTEEEYKKFKIASEKEFMNLSQFIRYVLHQWIKENENNK